MTETPPATAPQPSFVEQWGASFVVTALSVFALQMAVLVPLVRYGVDLGAFVTWIRDTLGVDLGLADGATSWWVAIVGAYAITRALKPISLALVVVLTPVVAKVGRPLLGDVGPAGPPTTSADDPG